MNIQQKIKLLISIVGVAITIILGSIYFTPIIDNQKKIKPKEKKTEREQTNYDSIVTMLYKNKESKFRKAFDSLVQSRIDSSLKQSSSKTKQTRK